MIIISTPKSGSSSLAKVFRDNRYFDFSYKLRKLFFRRSVANTSIGMLHQEFDQVLDLPSNILTYPDKLFIKGHFKPPSNRFLYGKSIFLYRDPIEIVEAWSRAKSKGIHPLNPVDFSSSDTVKYHLETFIHDWSQIVDLVVSFEDLINNPHSVINTINTSFSMDLKCNGLPKEKFSR